MCGCVYTFEKCENDHGMLPHISLYKCQHFYVDFQVMLKLYGMGFEFFKSKMEVFDAVIIISSFVLDLVFMEGVGVDRGEEAAALLIMFLLWRILRVINGMGILNSVSIIMKFQFVALNYRTSWSGCRIMNY